MFSFLWMITLNVFAQQLTSSLHVLPPKSRLQPNYKTGVVIIHKGQVHSNWPWWKGPGEGPNITPWVRKGSLYIMLILGPSYNNHTPIDHLTPWPTCTSTPQKRILHQKKKKLFHFTESILYTVWPVLKFSLYNSGNVSVNGTYRRWSRIRGSFLPDKSKYAVEPISSTCLRWPLCFISMA